MAAKLLSSHSEKQMSMYVHYRVPVVVEVELSTREILSVHVDDEAIEGPLRVTGDDDQPVNPKDHSLAKHVTETTIWPGWTSGY